MAVGDHVARRPQVMARPFRDGPQQPRRRQVRLDPPEQPGPPGDPQEQVPVGEGQGRKVRGRGQGAQQQPPGPGGLFARLTHGRRG